MRLCGKIGECPAQGIDSASFPFDVNDGALQGYTTEIRKGRKTLRFTHRTRYPQL